MEGFIFQEGHRYALDDISGGDIIYIDVDSVLPYARVAATVETEDLSNGSIEIAFNRGEFEKELAEEQTYIADLMVGNPSLGLPFWYKRLVYKHFQWML